MIEAICKDCQKVFVALPILGITHCPECGSTNTAVAVPEAREVTE